MDYDIIDLDYDIIADIIVDIIVNIIHDIKGTIVSELFQRRLRRLPAPAASACAPATRRDLLCSPALQGPLSAYTVVPPVPPTLPACPALAPHPPLHVASEFSLLILP